MPDNVAVFLCNQRNHRIGLTPQGIDEISLRRAIEREEIHESNGISVEIILSADQHTTSRYLESARTNGGPSFLVNGP